MEISLTDALNANIAGFAGNQEELSRRVCGSASGLRYKRSGYKGMHFSPEECVMLQQHTGTRHTLKAMALELGCAVIELPSIGAELPAIELDRAMAQLQSELGQMFAAMAGALEGDGKVDARERLAIDGRAHEVTAKMLRYLALFYRKHGERPFLPYQQD